MWVTGHPVLHHPCALRTWQMEPLNSLDFCSRNLMDVFISTCWTPVLLFGGHCDM